MGVKRNMILGKGFNWYFKIIQTTFLIVASWVVFSGLIGRIPLIGWAFVLISTPITWLLRLGGAGYVGYQTVKKYQGTNLQALVSGGIFGAGIGIASMIVSLLKTLLSIRVGAMFFGTFALVMVVISEAVTGLVVGFIGGIIAGSKNEEKK